MWAVSSVRATEAFASGVDGGGDAARSGADHDDVVLGLQGKGDQEQGYCAHRVYAFSRNSPRVDASTSAAHGRRLRHAFSAWVQA